MTFATAPETHRSRLEDMRAEILAAAADLAISVEETTKWGEPAFVPPKRVGTTLRLGHRPEHCALFVNCQTTLVDQWRTLFPDAFEYEGTRAALIPASGAFDRDAFHHIASMALTYHRDKP